MEDKYYWGIDGQLRREEQSEDAPMPRVSDKFYDVNLKQWAICTRVRPPEEALGAPFEAIYTHDDGDQFVGTAMYIDIGEVVRYPF
jgi:hypothetical protein